ncbi:hypothetical protein O6P43_025077 [Quillaja saponaria]|uniref:Uncharacterized protein n=1 Tax=Quillaja saponaria TaxID=32244 RepID=A0AAD7L8G2_QUISA|nr:hypothetical protein O6P43_025077 [Quillaja saponaria]
MAEAVLLTLRDAADKLEDVLEECSRKPFAWSTKLKVLQDHQTRSSQWQCSIQSPQVSEALECSLEETSNSDTEKSLIVEEMSGLPSNRARMSDSEN